MSGALHSFTHTAPSTGNDIIYMWTSNSSSAGFWASYADLVEDNPVAPVLMHFGPQELDMGNIGVRLVEAKTLALKILKKNTQNAWSRLKVLMIGMVLSEGCFAALQMGCRILQC